MKTTLCVLVIAALFISTSADSTGLERFVTKYLKASSSANEISLLTATNVTTLPDYVNQTQFTINCQNQPSLCLDESGYNFITFKNVSTSNLTVNDTVINGTLNIKYYAEKLLYKKDMVTAIKKLEGFAALNINATASKSWWTGAYTVTVSPSTISQATEDLNAFVTNGTANIYAKTYTSLLTTHITNALKK